MMRPLSASSYALLIRLNSADNDVTATALLWHYLHTVPVDDLINASDEQILDDVKWHGFAVPPEEIAKVMPRMTAELKRMNDAFVESETDSGVSQGPLASTTATSPTLPQA